jgi:transcriptional regulator GlxA family with amidase domain
MLPKGSVIQKSKLDNMLAPGQALATTNKPELDFEDRGGPSIMDPRIEHVVSFIRANYQRRLTLAELAATVNLSRWRLSHLFKLEMETSPERFLTQLRVTIAKYLLENEFLTVKEVMNRVGISSPSHFNRSFKAAYGITPSTCKRKLKKRDDIPSQAKEKAA